jgi:hypothetical protein
MGTETSTNITYVANPQSLTMGPIEDQAPIARSNIGGDFRTTTSVRRHGRGLLHSCPLGTRSDSKVGWID